MVSCTARAICLLRSSELWPLDLGRNLCFIHRARHGTLDRMRDHLENGFRHHQTDGMYVTLKYW